MFGFILFGCFIGLMTIGLPIAFSLLLASLAALIYGNYPITLFAQRMFTALDSFPLMAIPLFMLAGSLMSHGGIARRILSFILGFVGHIQGSLSHVVAIASVVLGGVSGSGVANTAVLATTMFPEMKKHGYEEGFSAALIACSGAIALIIPPSIAMVLYGVSAQVSIGNLFMAGIVPGVMIGMLFLAYSFYIAKKKGYPIEGFVDKKERWRRFREASWCLVIPLIIIFGIRGGIFTPTEGGAVMSVYAFSIGMFVYKDIKVGDIPKICLEAALNTAVVSTIIAATSLFSWLMTSEQIPQAITRALLGVTDNRVLLLLIINMILLTVGLFIDSGPSIILLTPILAPVATSLGMNLIQFGLVMVINLTIGLLTPPVGTAVFVASNISGVPIGKLFKSLIPFWAIMLFVLMLVTYIPIITMWVVW
jgi:C4-dicarboxylate transporter DctM subunit